MSRGRAAAGALAATALLLGLWLGWPGSEAGLGGAGAASTAPVDLAPPLLPAAARIQDTPRGYPQPDRAGPAAETAALPPGPRSLQGTEPDAAALREDGRGHLVLSPALRLLFDYFLSADGEEPEAVSAARFGALARARLSPGAAGEAEALLGRYLELRRRGAAVQGDLSQRLAGLAAQRRALLGDAAAEALFGDEEALGRAALARQAAREEPGLSPEERARRELAAEEALPPELRARRAQALLPLVLAEQERALRAAGAGDGEIERLRVAQVGPEAAARLGDLDRQRAAWDARVAAFRARLASLGPVSAEEQQVRSDQMLSELFSEPERLRVQALERIRGGR